MIQNYQPVVYWCDDKEIASVKERNFDFKFGDGSETGLAPSAWTSLTTCSDYPWFTQATPFWDTKCSCTTEKT